MIELHAWPTPNGFKISIMLEEVGLPYEVRPVDIGKGDQFDPEFLRQLMPASISVRLVDGQPTTQDVRVR